MAEIRLTVCDVCEATDRTTERYRVGRERGLRSVDLCEEHAEPIENLLREAPGRRQFHETVTTVDEIERIKRQKRKARASNGA